MKEFTFKARIPKNARVKGFFVDIPNENQPLEIPIVVIMEKKCKNCAFYVRKKGYNPFCATCRDYSEYVDNKKITYH